jgi:hypothetical protein
MFGLINIYILETERINKIKNDIRTQFPEVTYTSIYDQVVHENKLIFRREIKKNPLYFFYGNPADEAASIVHRNYTSKYNKKISERTSLNDTQIPINKPQNIAETVNSLI